MALATNGFEFIHHPGHDLRSGVNVGRGDIAMHTEFSGGGTNPCPGKTLFLTFGEFLWIAGHTALAATERNVDDGALPCHPRRERANGVNCFFGMPANAALGRAAGSVVLNAVPVKDVSAAIVHLDREDES